MRRLIAALIAILLLVLPASAADWSGVFDRTKFSVASLFSDAGSCTAFSIDQGRRHYLTADHCIATDGTMAFWKEGIPGFNTQGTFDVVRVLQRSKELDAAVVEGSIGLPALMPGPEPKIGSELASIGYALGEPAPWIFGSLVASVKDARSYGQTRRIIFRDNQDVMGVSGGPVVDRQGRVVAMVQQGLVVDGRMTNIAFGTSIKQLREFARIYWRA